MTNKGQSGSVRAGTARALQELKQFNLTAEEYGEETAVCLTAKAIQRYFPAITRDDVRGTVKVIRALESGKVSISVERHCAEVQAEGAANQLFGMLLQPDTIAAG